MELVKSPDFAIKRFYLTKTVIFCIFPENNDTVSFDKMKLDYDYNIFLSEREGGKSELVVSFSILCNKDEKPGYVMDIEAVGEFSLINEAGRNEKIRQQYILFTALPMVINSLRTYIQSVTSMHHYGTFILPTVDLVKLIEGKRKN